MMSANVKTDAKQEIKWLVTASSNFFHMPFKT